MQEARRGLCRTHGARETMFLLPTEDEEDDGEWSRLQEERQVPSTKVPEIEQHGDHQLIAPRGGRGG